MLTFSLSFIAAVIISYCFFKSKFWENRYLVLLIGTGVALVVTLVLNYSVRGHLQTKTEILWNKPMAVYYLPDSIYNIESKKTYLKNWDYYAEHRAKEFYKDTTKKQIPVTIVFYTITKKSKQLYIGVMKKNGDQNYWQLSDDVYLTKSSADSVAYITKKKLSYDVKPNSWIAGFSLPRKSTAIVLHIPPKEFALIPDSLIRKIPF
jgi:hypothetical protein